MTPHEKHLLTKRSVSAYACIAASLALVVFLGAWGVYRDLKLVRQSLLQAEVARVKSHAIRTVGRVEHDLELRDDGLDLTSFRDDTPLRRHWQEMTRDPEKQQFAAMIDSAGMVAAHSNPELEQRRLERDWYERIMEDLDRDVFETASHALSDGKPAYCVQVPILVNDSAAGDYYIGFSASWFESKLATKRAIIWKHWAWLFGGILLVVILATISLSYIAVHSAGYGRALGLLRLQRATELEQFAGGLAHEIRNPLHAIRLNLHTLARAINGSKKIDQDDLQTMIQETNQEIERVDGLVQQMLGFAAPGKTRQATVDVVEEVRSTVRFVQQELQRGGIEVREDFPNGPVTANIDPDRFRQIMLNLVINAKEELPEGGKLELRVRQRGKFADVLVSDNGPGVPASNRERIFEPFFSTKDHGSGLGLALVRRFVDDLGGRIWCEAHGNGCGTTFRLEIPRSEGKGAKHVD